MIRVSGIIFLAFFSYLFIRVKCALESFNVCVRQINKPLLEAIHSGGGSAIVEELETFEKMTEDVGSLSLNLERGLSNDVYNNKAIVNEECFNALKLCMEYETKGYDKVFRQVLKYNFYENTMDASLISVQILIDVGKDFPLYPLKDKGYFISNSLSFYFPIPNGEIKEKVFAEISSVQKININQMEINLNFSTDLMYHNIKKLFTMASKIFVIPDCTGILVHKTLPAFSEHMENLWNNETGQTFLKMLSGAKDWNTPISSPYLPVENYTFNQHVLNEEQTNAFNLVNENHPVCFIKAPPGTGKTFLASIIAASTKENIFMTAEANKAADQLADSFQRVKNKDQHCIRYYAERAEMKCNEELPIYSESSMIEKLELCYKEQLTYDELEIVTEYNRVKNSLSTYEKRKHHEFENIRKLRFQLFYLREQVTEILHRIYTPSTFITTVTYGKNSLHKKINPLCITKVIVDEASQMTLANFLYMASFFPNAKSFILIGDTNQLRPYFSIGCNPPDQLKVYLSSVLQYVQNSNVIPFTALIKSYRMHPAILELVSTSFYQSTLVSGILDSERRLALDTLMIFPNKKCPIIWYDTHGSVSKRASHISLSNEKEAGVVLRMVNTLISSGFKTHQIGIICMYKDQVNLIRALLKDIKVSVKTVDGVQGDEKDIIILCTTSTQMRMNKKCFNFLGDPKRINVAISRPRHALFIYGDVSCLVKNSEWEKVINYCKRQDVVKKAFDLFRL